MSKSMQTQTQTQTPPESGLSDPMTPPETAGLPEPSFQEAAETAGPVQNQQRKPLKPGRPKGSRVHRLSPGEELYSPKKRERERPALLTVEQYLRNAGRDEAVSGLIRSLHKAKVMSFADWEREAASLLKKKTW